MHPAHASHISDPPLRRALVVADWKLDPGAVAEACNRQHRTCPTSFALMVPARLHGVDWIGDPYAPVPCATQALTDLARVLERTGVPIHRAQVGYHDPIAAIMDSTLDHSVDEILLCERKRRLPNHPLDLPHRARRATALAVVAITLPDATAQVRAHLWRRFPNGHCPRTAPQTATAS